jgi:uncharacterized membrane protein HdeD (DUF308 family)
MQDYAVSHPAPPPQLSKKPAFFFLIFKITKYFRSRDDIGVTMPAFNQQEPRMSDITHNGKFFHDRLREASSKLVWLGLIMVLVGIAAIAFPIFSTLAATILAGWALLISGVAIFISSFWIHGTGPFFGANLFGLLSTAAGVFLLFNPFAGAVALTLLLGIMFMFQGASELVFALEMRPASGWVGMLLSGLASIALAIIIVTGWPGISLIALGLLIGINFLTTGFGYIFAARAFKR